MHTYAQNHYLMTNLIPYASWRQFKKVKAHQGLYFLSYTHPRFKMYNVKLKGMIKELSFLIKHSIHETITGISVQLMVHKRLLAMNFEYDTSRAVLFIFI